MKILLSVFILFLFPFISQGQIKSSELTYLRIAELEYSNDSLFLWQQIRPNLGRMDSTSGTYHKLPLSGNEKTKFLRLVDKTKLLSIQSNNKQKTGYFPFEIMYRTAGRSHEISSYEPGMSPTELESFHKYLEEIENVIDRRSAQERLLMTLADAEYQLKTRLRYQLRIGPSGWDAWEKKNGEIKRIGVPLLFVNGKEEDYTRFERSNPKRIKSFEILNQQKADSLYGERAKNGVAIITTK
ncbi:hypothetical protein [Sphingobacterium mizutaii]|uniref:hypothetical protein n=1 Tax=Sphingobacterium mizutaii TaxID=1010 RepID=UPI00162AD908|nr:hypothetical protein [Sphingobacterium mizutaii]